MLNIEIMSNNLDLWNKVEKTNPKYTKKANVKGNNITAIAPQYQIKNVTEQFGSYGTSWGFKSLEFDYTLTESLGLVILHAVLLEIFAVFLLRRFFNQKENIKKSL